MVTAIPGLQSFCLAAALCLAAIYLLQVNTVHTNSTKYKALTKSLNNANLEPCEVSDGWLLCFPQLHCIFMPILRHLAGLAQSLRLFVAFTMFQVSWFVAWVALDQKRAAAGRVGLLPCIAIKSTGAKTEIVKENKVWFSKRLICVALEEGLYRCLPGGAGPCGDWTAATATSSSHWRAGWRCCSPASSVWWPP